MPRPFVLVESVNTKQGPLELRRRDENDAMITIAGRVLMSSNLNRSEVAVAELGCARINTPTPRVLIGGLGLGYTLRAALDRLPKKAQVDVAELNSVVERWCRGPLKNLTNNVLTDPRVSVTVADVMNVVRRAVNQEQPYDAIIVDLYLGPDESASGSHPLYGHAALRSVAQALVPGGVYAVWSEEPSRSFEQRLEQAGFKVKYERTHGGGARHAVYLGIRGKGAPGTARQGATAEGPTRHARDREHGGPAKRKR